MQIFSPLRKLLKYKKEDNKSFAAGKHNKAYWLT